MKTPHYLRFVQALALAAVAPACSAADEADVMSQSGHATAAPDRVPMPLRAPRLAPTTTPMSGEQADASDTSDTYADSGIPHTSGPIVPPELPLGFA